MRPGTEGAPDQAGAYHEQGSVATAGMLTVQARQVRCMLHNQAQRL